MASQRRIAAIVGASVLLVAGAAEIAYGVAGFRSSGDTAGDPAVGGPAGQFAELPFDLPPACASSEGVGEYDWYSFGPEPVRSVSLRTLVEEQVDAGEVEAGVLDGLDVAPGDWTYGGEMYEFEVRKLIRPSETSPANVELANASILVSAGALDSEALDSDQVDVLVAAATPYPSLVEGLLAGKLRARDLLISNRDGELLPQESCGDRGHSELWQRVNADASGVALTPSEIGDRLAGIPKVNATLSEEHAPTPWEERDPADRHLFEEDAVPLDVRQQVRGIEVRVSAAALAEAGLSEGQFCSRQPIAEGGLCSHIDPEYSEMRFDVSAYRPEPVTILHLTGDFESELRGEEVTETEVVVIPVGDYPNGVDLLLVDGAWVVPPG